MIEVVQGKDKNTIQEIISLEKESFGVGGMNEWHLVPLIMHGRVFVIRKNNVVVGSVQYILDWSNPKRAYLFGVAISDRNRGEGLGTSLLSESFKELKRAGIKEIELTVDPCNKVAIKLYTARLGFEITGFREDEYGEGENRFVMLLSLENFQFLNKNLVVL